MEDAPLSRWRRRLDGWLALLDLPLRELHGSFSGPHSLVAFIYLLDLVFGKFCCILVQLLFVHDSSSEGWRRSRCGTCTHVYGGHVTGIVYML